MTASFSNPGKLHRAISGLIDRGKPTVISDHKDHVVVNGRKIVSKPQGWYVPAFKKTFYLKKSAVGFLVSKLNGDVNSANAIEHMDFRICKLSEDVFWYKRNMTASCPDKKFTASCRFSQAMDSLDTTLFKLDQKLKSVRIA